MCHHAFWMILDDLLDVLKETAVYWFIYFHTK
jgi:hypothetical protein